MLVEWMRKLMSHVQVSSVDPYVSNLEQGYDSHYDPWFREAMDLETIAIYIAEENDIPVGFVLGRVTEPYIRHSAVKRIGQIELCWVEPLYRRRGIATILVRQLETWFINKNIRYVDLQYLLGNVEAEHSWKQMGYLPYRIAARKKI